MDNLSPHNQESRFRRPHLLVACLLLSLLFHLLLILSLQTGRTTEQLQERTVIELVDVRLPEIDTEPQTQPIYEIDQQPPLPEPEIDVESPRRAERDQLVEREQAPEGDDSRDQSREISTAPAPVDQPPATEPSLPPAITAPASPPTRIIEPQQPEPVTEAEHSTPPQQVDDPLDIQEREPPRLTREQLFPSPSRLAEIAQGQPADRDRIREREDTEIGDEVWLNLQHDRLVSFFRRFHDRIERVWNYPAEAAMNGVEGTLELMIIVTRDGELIDVDLRRTSGSDLLDFEAIQAVYRAAPFGPLGRHYPHDELRIRAYFRYRITGRYIFGR